MRRLAAIAVLGLTVVLLVVAQIVLPGIAASQLRERLSAHGRVISVEVDAFPAIELLWHQADKVVVRMADYRAATTTLGSNLSQAADAGTLDATVGTLSSGLLTVRDATLHKRGSVLTGSAYVSETDLRAAIPLLQSVVPVASGAGTLILRGTALGVSIDAVVAARGGAILAAPDIPFGGLATITVFSNPHIDVESLAATPAAGGFTVGVRGRLR